MYAPHLPLFETKLPSLKLKTRHKTTFVLSAVAIAANNLLSLPTIIAFGHRLFSYVMYFATDTDTHAFATRRPHESLLVIFNKHATLLVLLSREA
jgi:hypothetical protein